MTTEQKHRVVWVENDAEEISYTDPGSKEIKFATWAHKEEQPDSTKFIEYSSVEEFKSEITQLKSDLKIAVAGLKEIEKNQWVLLKADLNKIQDIARYVLLKIETKV